MTSYRPRAVRLPSLDGPPKASQTRPGPPAGRRPQAGSSGHGQGVWPPPRPHGLAVYGQVHGRGWAWGGGRGRRRWGVGVPEKATFIICGMVSNTLSIQIIGYKYPPEIRE